MSLLLLLLLPRTAVGGRIGGTPGRELLQHQSLACCPEPHLSSMSCSPCHPRRARRRTPAFLVPATPCEGVLLHPSRAHSLLMRQTTLRVSAAEHSLCGSRYAKTTRLVQTLMCAKVSFVLSSIYSCLGMLPSELPLLGSRYPKTTAGCCGRDVPPRVAYTITIVGPRRVHECPG